MITRLRRHEQGASLVIVLIIVTVIALVLGAVLSLVDTSVRSSVKLSDQANTDYGVDGAAQVAIRQLQKGTFPAGTNCATTGVESTPFDNWIPSSNSDPGASLRVECSPDPSTGGSGHAANASPGSAVLTLASISSGDDGLVVDDQAPHDNPVKVRGGIFSNSTITVTHGALENTWAPPPTAPTAQSYIVARGDCSGTIIVDNGTKTCDRGTATDVRGQDPGTFTPHGASYDPPGAPTGNATISSCAPSDKFQTVSPPASGIAVITDATALTNLSGCTRHIVWFKPGTYYFNFSGASPHIWTVEDIFVVAGTPSSGSVLTSTPDPDTWPDACIPPTPTGTSLGTGAEFVFGGDSRMQVLHQGSPGGQVTICASNSPDGPPIALYGLKTAVGSIPAENGCITATVSRCPVLYTDQSPDTTLTIQGTTYTPNAWVHVSLNNSTNQIFRWGLITWSLWIDTTGSPDVSHAVIDVPDAALIAIPTPKIMYLTVYICPGSATCSSSGTLSLRAKVQLNLDGTVQVLSWSKQN